MLTQASVAQIRSGEITRNDGYVVIAMCFYPRGLKAELRDEYQGELAPDKVLFKEWQHFEKMVGHSQAFARSFYQSKFKLSAKGLLDLKRLAELGKSRKVYLVCQCEVGERCHREMLLLAARELFGAKVGKIFHQYSRFLERLKSEFHNHSAIL